MCEVFPSTIQGSFENLIQHYQRLTEVSYPFLTYEQEEYSFQKIEAPAKDATPSELSQLADEILVQIDTYAKKAKKLSEQHANYTEKMTLVHEQLKEINMTLIQLKNYQKFDSKCTTFDQTMIQKELKEKLKENKLLN